MKYQPGELKVVAYKDGQKWAEDVVKTTGAPATLEAFTDRINIKANGKDLAFITIKVMGKNGLIVPKANNKVKFSVEGPGEIIATPNGDPTNFTFLPSLQRGAFNRLLLAIVRGITAESGTVIVKLKSDGLEGARIQIITPK